MCHTDVQIQQFHVMELTFLGDLHRHYQSLLSSPQKQMELSIQQQ